MTDVLAAGGVTMVPLLIFSIVTGAFIFERCWFWFRLSGQKRIIQQALSSYQQSPQAALAHLKKHKDLPTARILLAPLLLENANAQTFRLALENAAMAELPTLKRFQTFFETVIGTAPLLGLLGTILGLIRVLSSLRIGEATATGRLEVTLGIGEALISTAMGLIVAIVTLLFANLFRALYRRQQTFIQTAGGQLELLYQHQNQQHL